MINPFEGILEKDKLKLLNLLEAHIYTFRVNQNILSTIRDENIIGIIIEGSAEIININYNGDRTVIERLEENSIFGKNLSNIESGECEIISKEITKITIIDFNKLINITNVNKSYYNVFLRNIFLIIDDKIKKKNERIGILTKKTIRNRLLEFFATQERNNHTKYIYLPFSFTVLADYLAVDRSAMSRELKYLKDEGFIEIKGRKITLLY
jgi:CRP-like cAMP-binding protein